MKAIEEIRYGLLFTKEYQMYPKNMKIERELACLKIQLSKILELMEEDDLIVGKVKHTYIGFSPQYGGKYTYFFKEEEFDALFNDAKDELTDEEIRQCKAMRLFWKKENTLNKLHQNFSFTFGYDMPDEFYKPGFANGNGRLAGTNVDFHRLIVNGVGGLKQIIMNHPSYNEFHKGLVGSLELLTYTCDFYINDYLNKINETTNENQKEKFKKVVEVLKKIRCEPPETFYEGLQLMWIYAISSDLMNYGRMDDYLGSLYYNDLRLNRITEAGAIELLSSLWKQFKHINKVHDCRVIVGGRGRKNSKASNALAKAIIKTSRKIKEVVPQLTLRYEAGVDDELMTLALETLSDGYCFPIIYSDETNIPAIEKALDVKIEEAEKYVPFGCGEYVLEGLSTGTPNNGINLLKALELVLHDGYDRYWEEQLMPSFGGIDTINDFDDLFEKYMNYVDEKVLHLAHYKKMNYDVAAEEAAYLSLSLLMDDCIERGKPLLEGGVRYLNATSEIFGMVSCADSLHVINELVYKQRKYTLKELVTVLDANYKGNLSVFNDCQSIVKYGNDDNEADAMAVKVYEHISKVTKEAGKKVGLNKYLMVSVNNSMSAEWGSYCMASACGRHDFAPMANGNGASIGQDREGLIPLLNSMCKFDNRGHAGVINNIRLTKKMMRDSFDKVQAIIKAFLSNEGVQLNITCIGKDDLLKAQIEPEKYQNLIVRIGGFSARFVELDHVIQNEIILRTTYEE